MKLLALLPFTFLIGCASVPMASLQEDAEAKKFTAPADQSRIYIYRDEAFGSAIKISVTVDGRLVGQTAPDVYYSVDVPPGDHQVSCMGESNDSLRVRTQKGQAVYIWQEMKMGAFSAGCALREMPKDKAQASIQRCKRAMASF